jgi:hypothetical protein
MSKRPVFEPETEGNNLVTKHIIEFTWYPGFAKEQKQKSLESLHVETKKNTNINTILEISTKSKESLGIDASAFNIKIKTKKGLTASVESFYQGSKVFENGGPYKDLYECSSLDSKKDERLKSSGELIGFEFEGTKWGLNDHFYDWLYLNALLQNKNISDQILNYDAFTDIEFNPKKSYNCQAYSAALYKSAKLRRYDLSEIKDPKKFKKLFPKDKLINFQLELF